MPTQAGYTTVEDLRAEGVPDSVSDARLVALGTMARSYIDRQTGLWFDLRTFSGSGALILEGRGTPILELPAPAKTITAFRVDGQSVNASEYVVYNRRPEMGADDFWYPRIEFRSLLRLERAFGPRLAKTFAADVQNIELEGSFGFVEADDTTPVGIQRACALLVVGTMKPLTQGSSGAAVKSETLGNYSYTLVDGVFTNVLTGNPELGMLLGQYTRVAAMVGL
jgi:hypothetical protein